MSTAAEPAVGRLLSAAELASWPDGKLRSAFVVGGDLVVTAWHCVNEIGATAAIWLRLPRQGGPHVDVPLRYLDHDQPLDAALLVPEEPDKWREYLDRIALPLGREVNAYDMVRAVGFPQRNRREVPTTHSGRVETADLTVDGARAIQVHVDAFAASTPEMPSGMSGGPLLRQLGDRTERVVGMVFKFPSAGYSGDALGGAVLCRHIDDLCRRFPRLATRVRPDNISRARAQRLVSRSDGAVNDLLVAIADRLRPQYDDEATRLGLTGSEPLPVSWHPVAAPHDRLVGSLPDVRRTLDEVDRHQLIILGPAGSGKTAIAYQLARQFLDDIRDGFESQLPFIVPLASWNPRTRSLFTWIACRIETAFADLRAQRDDFDVRNLLSRGLILPILDGLDEMADALQPDTLRVLGRRDKPWVLTSREDAFWRASAQEPPNRRIGIVRVDPIEYGQAKRFLLETSTPGAMDQSPIWAPFFAQLEAMDRQDSVRRTMESALSSPLLLSLAHASYRNSRERSPRDLLAAAADSRTTVESALIDKVVAQSFDPDNESFFDYDGTVQAGPVRRVWRNPREARRWLGFLARHLRETNLPNIRWWMLEQSTPVVIFPILAGLTIGLVNYVSTIYLVGRDYALLNFTVGMVTGAVLGVGGRYALAEGRQTSDQEISADDAENRQMRDADPWAVRKGLSAAFLLFLLPLTGLVYVMSLIAAQVVRVILQKPLPVLDAVTGWRTLLPAAGFLAFVNDVLLVAILYRYFTRVTRDDVVDVETETAIDPRLRFGGLPFRWTLLVAPLLALAVGVSGELLLRRFADAGLIRWHANRPGTMSTLLVGSGYAIEALAALACLSRWARFLVARAWLSTTARLPWDVFSLLDDAADRRVLRRAGATYAFRHAALQEHLAGPPERVTGRTARIAVGAALVALLAAGGVGTWMSSVHQDAGSAGPSVGAERAAGSAAVSPAAAGTATQTGSRTAAPSATVRSSALPPADSVFFAVLTDVDTATRSAVLHPAEFLEGAPATAACQAERPSEPAGCTDVEYYVRETGARPMTLPIADGAVLKEKYGSMDCPDKEDGCAVTPDRLAQLLAQPNAGGKRTTMYVDVSVAGGRITRMVERYTP